MINRIQKAGQLIQLERYQDARLILTDILTEDADLFVVHTMLALVAYQEGNYKLCITHSETSLSLNPEDAKALYFCGLSYHNLSYSAKGVKLMEEAISIDAEKINFKLGLAEVLMELDHHGRAEAICRQVLENEPNSAEAYALLAELAHLNGDKKDAQFYAEAAIRLDPYNTSIQVLLGQLALKQYQVDKSSALLGQAVLSDPGNFLLREQLIDSELGKGSIYKWLAMKGRAFYVIGYLVIFLQYFVAVVGMIALRAKNALFDWYVPLQYAFCIVIVWMLLFWVVRLGGHYFFSRKQWNLSLSDFISPMYLVHLGVILTLICALLYIQTSNFLWTATAVIIGFILVQVSFTELLIEDKKKLKFVRIYQALMALVGVGVFVGYWNSYDYVRFLSGVLMFGLFGLVILWLVGQSLLDTWKERKGEKATDKDKTIKEVDSHSTTFDNILGYAFYPIIILAPLIFTLLRIEFYNVPRVVVCSVVSIFLIELAMYFVYKKYRPLFLSTRSTTQSSEGRMGAIFRSALTYAALAVVLFLTTLMLSGTRSKEWVSHEILRHDYRPNRNEKSNMVVKLDKPIKVRPPKEIMKSTEGKDCVEILLEEKMLGIKLLVDYRLCE